MWPTWFLILRPLLALSLLFNVFFLAGYARARDQANQNTSVKPVTDRVAAELGLDDEQIALYRQLRSGFSEELAAIDDELAVVEFELLDEMRQPKADVDVQRVREYMDRQVELRHQRYRLSVRHC